MARQRLHDDDPYEIADLMRVTGMGRDACRAAVRAGELPGYVAGRRYVIPAEAFRSFCAGTWVPQPRKIEIVHVYEEPPTQLHPVTEKQLADSFVRTRKVS
jgi:hypothetical protein